MVLYHARHLTWQIPFVLAAFSLSPPFILFPGPDSIPPPPPQALLPPPTFSARAELSQSPLGLPATCVFRLCLSANPTPSQSILKIHSITHLFIQTMHFYREPLM